MSAPETKMESEKNPTTTIVDRILNDTKNYCLANVLLTIAETSVNDYNLESMAFNTKSCAGRPGQFSSFCPQHRNLKGKDRDIPSSYSEMSVLDKLIKYSTMPEFDFLTYSHIQGDRKKMVTGIINYANVLRQKRADLMDIVAGSEQIAVVDQLNRTQLQQQSVQEQLNTAQEELDRMTKENGKVKTELDRITEEKKTLQANFDAAEEENEELLRENWRENARAQKYSELFEKQKRVIEKIQEHVEKKAIIDDQKMRAVFNEFEFPKYPDSDGQSLFSDRTRKVIEVDTIDLLRAPAIDYPLITDPNFKRLLYANVFSIPMMLDDDKKTNLSVIDYAENNRTRSVCQGKYDTIPQKFLPFYFTPDSPYKSLLIYHNVGTGKTRALFNIIKKFQTKEWKRIFVTTSKLRDDILAADPPYKDINLTWPDKKPGEVFGPSVFTQDREKFHSDQYKIEVLTYEELYQLLTRTAKSTSSNADKSARDKMYGPFTIQKKAKDNPYRAIDSFFEGTNHRYSHLKDPRIPWGQHRFYDGEYVQETKYDFLKKTILVFDEIHTAHLAMLEFLRDCCKDSHQKSKKDSVRCVFASATPFEQGDTSTLLILKLLLFDHDRLSEYESSNNIAQFSDEDLYRGRISYFGYKRNTKSGDFAEEKTHPGGYKTYAWDGHVANIIEVKIPAESLEEYKKICGEDVPKGDFSLSYIKQKAPPDFYGKLGISKTDKRDRLVQLEEIAEDIPGGEERIRKIYRSFSRGCLSHHISVGETPVQHRLNNSRLMVKENTKMKRVIDHIKNLKGRGLQVLYSGINYKDKVSRYASTGESVYEMIVNDEENFVSYDSDGKNAQDDRMRVAFIGRRQKDAPDNSEKYKKAFNDPKNTNGEDIGLIVLDNSVTQGVSLSNVRYMHILEYGNTEAEMTQVVGRAIRLCGHRDLERKDRDIYVYIYAHQDEKVPESSENAITELTRIMEKVSIDSGLYTPQEEIKAANNRLQIFCKLGVEKLSADDISDYTVYFKYRYPLVSRYPRIPEEKGAGGIRFLETLAENILDRIGHRRRFVYDIRYKIPEEKDTIEIAKWFNIYKDLNFLVRFQSTTSLPPHTTNYTVTGKSIIEEENVNQTSMMPVGNFGQCWPVFELEDRSTIEFHKTYDQKDLSGLLGIIYMPNDTKDRTEDHIEDSPKKYYFMTFGTDSWLELTGELRSRMSVLLGRVRAKNMKQFFGVRERT